MNLPYLSQHLPCYRLFPQRVNISLKQDTYSPLISHDRDRTYLVSSPITTYYYTQLIGDAKTPPTLLASASFNGIAVIGMFLSICSLRLFLTSDCRCGPLHPWRWRRAVVCQPGQLVSR